MIGLLTLFGIGWSTALLVERPRLIVPLVTALAAYWPRSIWYKHEFIAESFLLAAFVAVVALLLTPRVANSHAGFCVVGWDERCQSFSLAWVYLGVVPSPS